MGMPSWLQVLVQTFGKSKTVGDHHGELKALRNSNGQRWVAVPSVSSFRMLVSNQRWHLLSRLFRIAFKFRFLTNLRGWSLLFLEFRLAFGCQRTNHFF